MSNMVQHDRRLDPLVLHDESASNFLSSCFGRRQSRSDTNILATLMRPDLSVESISTMLNRSRCACEPPSLNR